MAARKIKQARTLAGADLTVKSPFPVFAIIIALILILGSFGLLMLQLNNLSTRMGILEESFFRLQSSSEPDLLPRTGAEALPAVCSVKMAGVVRTFDCEICGNQGDYCGSVQVAGQSYTLDLSSCIGISTLNASHDSFNCGGYKVTSFRR
jgi:hypothetical protein